MGRTAVLARDWLVVLIALSVGVTLCGLAVVDHRFCRSSRVVQWIERRWGRRASLAFVLLVGLVFCLLAGVVLLQMKSP